MQKIGALQAPADPPSFHLWYAYASRTFPALNHAINELFCDPTFFDRTSREQVKKLEAEQKTLSGKIEELMAEWESLESQIGELKG